MNQNFTSFLPYKMEKHIHVIYQISQRKNKTQNCTIDICIIRCSFANKLTNSKTNIPL